MQRLRRDLFLLVARNAEHPKPAFTLYDEAYDLDGKNVAEARELFARVNQDFYLEMLREAGLKPPPLDATPTPRPVLPTTPTYAKHPPLKVTHCWNPDRTPNGPIKFFNLRGPAFEPEANSVWYFGNGPRHPDGTPGHSFVVEVSLPTLKINIWPLPASLPRLDGNMNLRIFPEARFLYVAKDGQFLAIGNRHTREWKVTQEVLPHRDFARVGDELFFLTGDEATRGMSSISMRDQTTTLLAGKRRTPLQSPLDRADLTAIDLRASAAGVIEIITEPFDPANVASALRTESRPLSRVIFDPAKRTWTEPALIDASVMFGSEFPPLTAAGRPKAYKKNPHSNVWTLQLPRSEMPKVRVPIEFVAPASDRTGYQLVDTVDAWYWVPSGYLFIDSNIYFIPQSELDAYLDAYTPDEDETGAHAPAPAKKAMPR